jgi:hypothetical protein
VHRDAESTLAEAQYRACQVVGEFIATSVQPVVDRAVQHSPTPLNQTAQGYLLRTLCWFRSVGKLNHPSDFQALAAGARSLLEIVIDLTLLKHDPDSPVQKILDWELSEKYRASLGKLESVRKEPSAHDAGLEALYSSFIVEKRDEVERVRSKWWPRGKAPRWTGRNLLQDAELCDELTSSQHRVCYRLKYASLCWNTHGSAMVMVRSFDERAFSTLMADYFNDVSLLGRRAAALVLAVVDRYDESMLVRLEQLEKRCAEARRSALS